MNELYRASYNIHLIFITIQINDVQPPGSTTLTLNKTNDFHGKFNNFLHNILLQSSEDYYWWLLSAALGSHKSVLWFVNAYENFSLYVEYLLHTTTKPVGIFYREFCSYEHKKHKI